MIEVLKVNEDTLKYLIFKEKLFLIVNSNIKKYNENLASL
jgi:hypothetical protein